MRCARFPCRRMTETACNADSDTMTKEKNRAWEISGIVFQILLYSFFGLYLSGCSEISSPADTVPPQTPRNFTSIGGGDGQAHFRWEKNTEIDLNTYRIYRSVDDMKSFTKLVDLTQTEYTDRFLEYTSTYYYYITALDNAGNESLPSNIIDVQPLNISAPQPPSQVIVSGYNNPLLSQKMFKINWTPPDIGDLKQYIIYRGANPDFAPDTITCIDSTSIAYYTDSSVPINTRYYFKIIAVDKGFKTSLPSKAGGDLILDNPVLLVPANNTRFGSPWTLKWKPVENAVKYEVFIGNGPFSDAFWSSGKIDKTEITYNGVALLAGKVYYWWIGAYSQDKLKTSDGTEITAPINSYSAVNSFFSE
jgi:hypothetical protein